MPELVRLVETGELRPCRALDVGCGTGVDVIYLASRGFEAHGVDVSRVALSRAARRSRSAGVSCVLHLLDFRETERVRGLGSFDLVIDVGCYHSLPPGKDRAAYAWSLEAVLEPGGQYLLWAFPRDRRRLWGPPGIEEGEVEQRFGGFCEVLEEGSGELGLLFYRLRRVR